MSFKIEVRKTELLGIRMAVSFFKKVNTLGVTYTQGGIRDHHYETIFENIMGIPEDEICGIDYRDNGRFVFKVTSHQRYDEIVRNFTCRDIFLEHGNVIRIDDISTEGTIVELTRVPFEVSNEMLTQLLQNFGDVVKCESYHSKFGKYSRFRDSGFRLAWLKIKTHIPHSIYINQIQNFINVSYHKQPFLCNTCGNVGHSVRRCNVKPENYKNVVDLHVFETNDIDSEKETQDCNKELSHNNESKCPDCEYSCPYISDLVEHMKCHTSELLDVHLDPSQKKQKFDCSKCEYSCGYENIFIEHMQCHIGEKSIECTDRCHQPDNAKGIFLNSNMYACKLCDFTGKSEKHLSDHNKMHNGKVYKCTKCVFMCKTTFELKEHMDNHTGEKDLISQHEIAVSPVHDYSTLLLNNGKRGLSISPEMTETNKKSLRSNTDNISKKSKN